ncbi:hypothetical protein BKA70DRAFT_1226910 [Coprinopsis sp. MPI-PUGE-AT-0042]|nr:hypothetical protein BKA70DRAFT_1226910 [Coprinopsis sp. MPI-PUGE-AT-0042]
MLKAIMQRARDFEGSLDLKLGETSSRRSQARCLEKSRIFADEQYRTFSDSASLFCNNETGHSKKLKDSLHHALSQGDERKRAEYLVDGLNATLLAHEGRALGYFSHQRSNEDLIFVLREEMNEEEEGWMSIAGTTLRNLYDLWPTRTQEYDLKRWIDRLSTKTWKRIGAASRLTPSKSWNIWNVHLADAIDHREFPAYAPELHSKHGAGGSTTSQHLASQDARKRKRQDEYLLPSSKRRKLGLIPCRDQDPKASALASASSHVDLLCSKWNRTHSIGFILEGKWLCLRWYDPQGCISTEPIDIISELPLLVMTVILLQRLSPRMRGAAWLNMSISTDGGDVPITLPDTAQKPWELKGRHAVFSSPIPFSSSKRRRHEKLPSHGRNTRANARAAADSKPSLDDLFLKLSWRMEGDSAESTTIATAKERAEHYLPKPEYVTNHLPDVKLHQDFDEYSTRHIRGYLDLDTQASRKPSVTVMRKLQPMERVIPSDFNQVIWQIIRCLYLLWQVGVAHGDLSFWNMMIDPTTRDAILIDFDHAVIMQPGCRTPPNLDRVGTRPFIALDLGRTPETRLERKYHHDLESLLWCMVWYCQEQPEWTTGSFRDILGAKSAWMRLTDFSTVPSDIREGASGLWDPITKALLDWISIDFRFPGNPEPKTDRGWTEVIHKQFPCPSELGTDWMSFEVSRPLCKDPSRTPVKDANTDRFGVNIFWKVTVNGTSKSKEDTIVTAVFVPAGEGLWQYSKARDRFYYLLVAT